jgi:hypothetical protein
MSFVKLWDMQTDSAGELRFEVPFERVQSHASNFGQIALFVCANNFSNDGSNGDNGNLVNIFVEKADIGKTIKERFVMFKK